MAIKVKDIGTTVTKWTTVTPARSADYVAAAKVAGDDWERNALAAAAAYRAAVTAGNIDKMFTGGIRRVGAEKYNRKVEAVGETRFSQGITAGAPDYEKGVAPYLDLMRGLTLPDRQPRGSEANLARVRTIMVENHKKRLALRAAGS
jgi:hypothetical protein